MNTDYLAQSENEQKKLSCLQLAQEVYMNRTEHLRGSETEIMELAKKYYDFITKN